MVVGRYWTVYNANSAAPIHHRHTIHWHVKRESDSICCWIEQGLTELNLKLAEPKVSNRGGKTLLLSSDMRKKRLQLLQRHARLVQMLKEEMEKLATDETTSQPLGSWDRVSVLGQRLDELKDLIEPLGGVPVGWLNQEDSSSPNNSAGLEQPANSLPLALTG